MGTSNIGTHTPDRLTLFYTNSLSLSLSLGVFLTPRTEVNDQTLPSISFILPLSLPSILFSQPFNYFQLFLIILVFLSLFVDSIPISNLCHRSFNSLSFSCHVFVPFVYCTQSFSLSLSLSLSLPKTDRHVKF